MKKLNGWKEKVLSQVGKEILIKNVIQAITTYIMSCFLLPISIIRSLNSIVLQFFLVVLRVIKKMCWKSWEDFCKSQSMGGWVLKIFNVLNLYFSPNNVDLLLLLHHFLWLTVFRLNTSPQKISWLLRWGADHPISIEVSLKEWTSFL